MLYSEILQGEKIYLRQLEIEDCKEYYLRWLEDENINRYLETRWEKQSLDKIKDFVKSIRESTHSYIFAIIQNEKHIGNIKIGPIHPIYKFADVSYFLGETSSMGNGVATEAVGLVLKFAFDVLKLNRVQAGAFEQNIASQRVLEKNGFKKEAVFRKKYFLKTPDKYCDLYEYAILKSEAII